MQGKAVETVAVGGGIQIFTDHGNIGPDKRFNKVGIYHLTTDGISFLCADWSKDK